MKLEAQLAKESTSFGRQTAERMKAERAEQETMRRYVRDRQTMGFEEYEHRKEKKRVFRANVPAGTRKRLDYMTGKSTCDARDEEVFDTAYSRWWWTPNTNPHAAHISLAIQQRSTLPDRLRSTYKAQQEQKQRERLSSPDRADEADTEEEEAAAREAQKGLNTAKLDTLQYLRELKTASLERKHGLKKDENARRWSKLRKSANLTKKMDTLDLLRGNPRRSLPPLDGGSKPGLRETMSVSPSADRSGGDGEGLSHGLSAPARLSNKQFGDGSPPVHRQRKVRLV